MQKKAQMSESILVYAITAIIAVSLLTFGINALGKYFQGKCQAELQQFKIDVVSSADGLAHFSGSTEIKTYLGICNADRIYFVDPDNSLPETFEDKKEIDDSLSTGGTNNVFVYSGNTLLDSFSTGRLSMGFPYFTCIQDANLKFDFTIEGKPFGIDILETKASELCNPSASTILDTDKMAYISTKTNMTTNFTKENINKTNFVIEQPVCLKTDNQTVLKVIVGYKSELTNVSVYHSLPNCIADNLVGYISDSTSVASSSILSSLQKGWLDESEYNIAEFKFKSTTSTNGIFEISYSLSSKIDDNCQDYCNITVINHDVCDTTAVSPTPNGCLSNYICGDDGICRPSN